MKNILHIKKHVRRLGHDNCFGITDHYIEAHSSDL